jgi:hypothetical protein
VFGASAGAALYRRAMLDEVGLFDERFFCLSGGRGLGLAGAAGRLALPICAGGARLAPHQRDERRRISDEVSPVGAE